MLYVTGASGLLGKRVIERWNSDVTKISYRDKVPDIFKKHKNSCLLHLGWSSIPSTQDESVLTRDVTTSEILFSKYLEKNPNGKIIFTSSAGDLHQGLSSEYNFPSPRTRYGECKLKTETILKNFGCYSTVLRVSNIWGGDPDPNRKNGLVDKLIRVINTDEEVQLSVNLRSCLDLIHIDDLITLIYKVILSEPAKHRVFLVGGQSISIWDIIDVISKRGYLKLKIDQQKREKFFLDIDSSRAKTTFDWETKNYLK